MGGAGHRCVPRRGELTIVKAKAVFLAAMLCGLMLPPAQAEVRIRASLGGQVGPFLDLLDRKSVV